MTTHLINLMPSRYAMQLSGAIRPNGQTVSRLVSDSDRDSWVAATTNRGDTGPYGHGMLFRFEGLYVTATLHYHGEGGATRKVFQGPVDSEPQAYLSPQATVISAHQSPAEPEHPEPLAVGDELELYACSMHRATYRVVGSRYRGECPSLVQIGGPGENWEAAT